MFQKLYQVYLTPQTLLVIDALGLILELNIC